MNLYLDPDLDPAKVKSPHLHFVQNEDLFPILTVGRYDIGAKVTFVSLLPSAPKTADKED